MPDISKVQSLAEAQQFLQFAKDCKLKELNDFCSNSETNVPPETNGYVLQAMLEVADGTLVCEKRIEMLRMLVGHEMKVNHVPQKQHSKGGEIRKINTITKVG